MQLDQMDQIMTKTQNEQSKLFADLQKSVSQFKSMGKNIFGPDSIT